jgi:alkanesulfonate monooxygenase SsuD/methylene tetrahydromethanopterin reductase-like flavin-dependent oxidoreductase (luciferase family)
LAKLKFGVFIPFYAFKAKTPYEHYEHIKGMCLECERLGYDSVWLDDHLMYNNWPILEPWTTLSALSSLTSKIRLGTMVSCNQHRNPALLAKTAATLDVLSRGRLAFGIGAGIQQEEHTAYGFGFPKLGVRVERLIEALEVITRLWTKEKASFNGKHYTLNNAVCEPKPLQKPYPQITVGGSGEKTLQVTAKFADRFDWGYLPSIEEYKQKLEALNRQCKAIGRNFSNIEWSCWPGGQVLVADDEKDLNLKVSKLGFKTSLKEFRKTGLAGTPEECVERVKAYANLGVTYFMLFFADLPSLEGIKKFSESVVKKMQK